MKIQTAPFYKITLSQKKRVMLRTGIVGCLFLAIPFIQVLASGIKHESMHLGFFHPSGVDFVGYTVETPLTVNVYRFHNFGFPSLAAIGLSYFENYQSSGLTSSLGIGIGSVLYGSAAYQLSFTKIQFLKIGAGFTTGVAYTGLYPVLSYEHRF